MPFLVALGGWLARGFTLAAGPFLNGLKFSAGLWLGQIFLGLVLTVGAWAFRDQFLGMIGGSIDLVTNGLNNIGLDIPTVREAMQALPDEMLVILKRVGADEAMAIVASALGVRGVMSLYRTVRGVKTVASNSTIPAAGGGS